MNDLALRRIDGRPLTSYAQYLADSNAGKPDAGFILSPVNMRALVGGLMRFHPNEAQIKACALMKSWHERGQLGGSKAIDPSIEAVDGGGNDPEAAVLNGSEARKRYASLAKHLERTDMQRLEYVVILERGPTAYARFRYGKPPYDGQQVSRYSVELRTIATKAAQFLGFQSR